MLPALKTFDGIIGCEFLHLNESVIDVNKGILYHKRGKDALFYNNQIESNTLIADKAEISFNINKEFEIMIHSNKNAFADSSRGLPFNVNVGATIGMTTNEPIYLSV